MPPRSRSKRLSDRPVHEKGELEILRLVRQRLGARQTKFEVDGVSAEVTLGALAGDDSAALALGEAEIVLTTDYVRGTGFHLFRLGLIDHRALGRFLAVANLSDIAAMGACPIGLLTVLRYDDSMSEAALTSILDGLHEVTKQNGVPVLGGDIGGADTPVLCATAIGLARRGHLLTRRGAQVGDDLYVTGSIGKAAAGLVYGLSLRGDAKLLTEVREEAILAPWRRPEARIEFGRALAREGVATACQDISDGLHATLRDMVSARGLGARIKEAALPMTPATAAVVARVAGDPLRIICGASTDFELCFTAPPTTRSTITGLARQSSIRVTRIGIITDDDSRLTIIRRNGRTSGLPSQPWNQQMIALEELFELRKE